MVAVRLRTRRNGWCDWTSCVLYILSVVLVLTCGLIPLKQPILHRRQVRIHLQRNPASEPGTGAITDNNVNFRALKVTDIEAVSNLLVGKSLANPCWQSSALLMPLFLFPSFVLFPSECFETELKWFDWPERETRRKRYRDMLQSSFVRRMEKALETDTTNLSLMLLVEKNAKMVGFVQIGMLPPPPGFQSSNGIPDNSSETRPVLWKGVPVNLPNPQSSLDVPYIANLCVLPPSRRSGLGKKMVDICIKWLAKRNNQDENTNNLQNVFIAVAADNLGAKRFYLGNGFTWIEPPIADSAVGGVAKREYYYRPVPLSRS